MLLTFVQRKRQMISHCRCLLLTLLHTGTPRPFQFHSLFSSADSLRHIQWIPFFLVSNPTKREKVMQFGILVCQNTKKGVKHFTIYCDVVTDSPLTVKKICKTSSFSWFWCVHYQRYNRSYWQTQSLTRKLVKSYIY